MNEERKVRQPLVSAGFTGDRQQPQAGSDIARLIALSGQESAAAGINSLGAEMRSRYLTSRNLNATAAPNPVATTEGEPVMGGWEWHGKKQ